MSDQTKKCPMCGEEILFVAIKCKHCGSMLNNAAGYANEPSEQQAAPAAIVKFKTESATSEEIRDFIGPKSEYYVNKNNKIGVKRNAISWNWAAFIFAFNWAAYRKMYGIAWVYIVSVFVVDLANIIFNLKLKGYANLSLAVLFGLYANSWYRDHAQKQIAKIKKLCPKPDWAATIARKGGTNTFASVAFALLIFLEACFVFAYDEYIKPNFSTIESYFMGTPVIQQPTDDVDLFNFFLSKASDYSRYDLENFLDNGDNLLNNVKADFDGNGIGDMAAIFINTDRTEWKLVVYMHYKDKFVNRILKNGTLDPSEHFSYCISGVEKNDTLNFDCNSCEGIRDNAEPFFKKNCSNCTSGETKQIKIKNPHILFGAFESEVGHLFFDNDSNQWVEYWEEL